MEIITLKNILLFFFPRLKANIFKSLSNNFMKKETNSYVIMQ